jgi:ATP-binding cassette subfamily F protein 3
MIRFDNVQLRRAARLLLSGTSFTIHAGQKLGLTGANGAGKSSLLELLLGRLQADSGEVEIDQGLVIAHVAQETPVGSGSAADFVIDGDSEYRELELRLKTLDAVRESAAFGDAQSRFESIGGYAAAARSARLLNGLGFSAEQQQARVDELSGGWRARLALARALMCRSDLLLLDEPTNHLDLEAVIWLQQWLSMYQGTLILISHDREFLDEVVDHVLHIENGNALLYSGNYSAFESRRAEHLAQMQSQREKQLREIARIQGFVDRFRAKATKARQVQSRMKALSRMELIAQAHVDSALSFSFSPPEKLPRTLLTLESVTVEYGSRVVLKGVDLTFVAGDRVGLLGPNGAGKTTLIKTMAGEIQPVGGQRTPSSETTIGYFAQHSLEQLNPAASALDHLLRRDRRTPERELRSFLGRFAFTGERVLDPVGTFSGGERARLALALLVHLKPNLLLLDEPTNHLDIDMRFSLAKALQDFPGAIVLVSHDRFMLRSVVDEFWLVQNSGVERFAGDLEDYRQRVNDVRDCGKLSSVVSPRDKRRNLAETRSRLRPLEMAVRKTEEEMERVIADLRKLEQSLVDPGTYSNPEGDTVRSLVVEKSEKDRMLRELEERWLTASDALESAREQVQS